MMSSRSPREHEARNRAVPPWTGAVYIGAELLLPPAGERPSATAFTVVDRCKAAGLEPVLMTRLPYASVAMRAMRLGIASLICEGGAVLLVDRKRVRLGPMTALPILGMVREQIEAAGDVHRLLEAFRGQLERCDPDEGLEATHLLRGQVDLAAANALLRDGALELQLADEGELAEGSRVYRLMPAQTGNGPAIVEHRALRETTRDRSYAIGASLADADAAHVTRQFTEAQDADGVLAAVVALLKLE